MDYLYEPVSEENVKKLLDLIDGKQLYLIKNRLRILPAEFDIGDTVGVFIPYPKAHHVIGQIIAVNGTSIDLQLESSQLRDVSVWQLFRLTAPPRQPQHQKPA